MATLRIEYVSDDGHLCSVEHEAAEFMCRDTFAIQVHLFRIAGQILPALADDISCGADDRPDCRGILGSK